MSILRTDTLQNAAGTKSIPVGTVVDVNNLVASTGIHFRNRIINGDMRIDQRNNGASVTLPGALDRWITDRWAIQAQAGGTAQQIASTLGSGFAYSLRYTANASNSFVQLGQQIEFFNMSDLQGQTVTISFFAKANNSNAGSTSFIVRTRESTTQDAGIRFSGANTDTTVTLSTTPARYTVQRTIGASCRALSMEFVLGSHVSGDGFEITGVQLEAGSVATPFERRDYGRELMMCQRYCYVVGGVSVNENMGSGWTTTTTGVNLWAQMPVAMRAIPSVTPSGSLNIQTTNNTVNSLSSLSVNSSESSTLRVGMSGGGSSFTANIGAVVRAADINSRITFSSEL